MVEVTAVEKAEEGPATEVTGAQVEVLPLAEVEAVAVSNFPTKTAGDTARVSPIKGDRGIILVTQTIVLTNCMS